MIISAHKVHIHAYILLWTQGNVFNLLYGDVKKKKQLSETMLQLRASPHQHPNFFFLVLAFRKTCANMSALLVTTKISFFWISHCLALKGQSNFIHSSVPQLCYYRTLKCYTVFWDWFWNNCFRSYGTMTGLPQACAFSWAFCWCELFLFYLHGSSLFHLIDDSGIVRGFIPFL